MKKITIYLKSILTLILFFISRYFVVIPVAIFNIDTKNMSNQTSILLTLFSNVMLAIILILIYYKDLKLEFKKFKENGLANLDTGFKYWFIGLVVMMLANILITFLTPSNGANNEQAVQSMIKISPWVMLINAGILAPIIEEITFRKTFKDMIKNKWAFILIAGIVFGGLHVIQATNIYEALYIIPYSALGISFAYMYYKTDTIYTSIFMHFFHNTILTMISILSNISI